MTECTKGKDPIYHGIVKLSCGGWATEVKRGRWIQIPLEVVKKMEHGQVGDWFAIEYWKDKYGIEGIKLAISTEPRNSR